MGTDRCGRYRMGVPQLPDTAGSARARMRLAAVLLLIPITAYWGVYAIYLLFLPEGSPGATFAVLIGAICLVFAGVYGLVTWGVAKRRRGLHLVAILVTGLGVLQVFAGQTWDVWLLAAVNLITLGLLTQTIPVGKPKP